MTTYDACKKLIENGRYGTKEEIFFKLDIFLLGNRILQTEYDELVGLVEQQTTA